MTIYNDITLVLGGARSGKTAYAERLACQSSSRPVYLATAKARDDEMYERIARHQKARGDGWELWEVPLHIDRQLLMPSKPRRVVLIDCLTLWLMNLTESEVSFDEGLSGLVEALTLTEHQVILVSSELGLGLVPADRASRQFRDQHGLINQAVADVAGRVIFVAAGLPLALKGALPSC